jgi:hypothetical protein
MTLQIEWDTSSLLRLVFGALKILLNHCCCLFHYQLDHFHCHIVGRSNENVISNFAINCTTPWIQCDVVWIAQT